MVSSAVVIGSFFVIGLFVLGAFQSYYAPLPRSALVGAVTERSQTDINLCQNDCMRQCATADPLTVDPCREQCDSKCL
jgi:hypothetical protein